MYPSGSLSGEAGQIVRPLVIGATISEGQIVCQDSTNQYGTVGDPAGVNDLTEAFGVSLEAATYTATQGSAFVRARCSIAPLTLFRAKCSGGTTADTDLAETTDGNLLTNTTASAGGTVITDADVGSSDFLLGGIAVGLTGNNAGSWRYLSVHTDATSTAVNAAFSSAIAVGDTFVRCYGTGVASTEVTDDYTQVNIKHNAGENIPQTGHAAIVDCYIDGVKLVDPENAHVENTTQPVVEVDLILYDHVWNSIA
jgi:hypothetical protein